MKLSCVATGSKGNCYLLESENEVLILDCGVNAKTIKRALGWDISRVVGVCSTHAHSDHSKSVKDFEKMGIPVFAPYKEKYLHIHGKFSERIVYEAITRTL